MLNVKVIRLVIEPQNLKNLVSVYIPSIVIYGEVCGMIICDGKLNNKTKILQSKPIIKRINNHRRFILRNLQ